MIRFYRTVHDLLVLVLVLVSNAAHALHPSIIHPIMRCPIML
jgi:hypothetical protein